MRTLAWITVLSTAAALVGCDGGSPPSFGGDTGDADGDSDTDSDVDSDSDTDSDTDGDTDSDSDADGGPDTETDECPGDVHDEDGDGRADSCDNCPTYGNPDQEDADTDGLGDACEAYWNAELLGQVAVFVPFTSSEGWVSEGGTWTPGVDQVTGSSAPTGGNYQYQSYAIESGNYAVEAMWSGDMAGTTGAVYSGVVFGYQVEMMMTTWWSCLYEQNGDVLSIWENDGFSISLVGQVGVDGADDESDWRRVRVFFNGLSLLCRYEEASGASAEVVLDDWEVPSDMSGPSGLRVYNETSVFRSFAIYR